MDKELLDYLKGFEGRINGQFEEVRRDIKDVKEDVGGLKQDVEKMNKKLDVVYDQVYNLTEFKTEVLMKLDDMNENIAFLNNKTLQNEKAVFVLSNKITK